MNKRDQGLFITLEGIEGVGKSTQVGFVVGALQRMGWDVIESREPGGTELGEQIRTLLLAKDGEVMHADTELQLMFAARAEHLQKKILPALRRGNAVVCDRFTDATYAYQGGGRGVSPKRISILEQFVQGELRPDLTLLLDAPVNVALARSRKRSAADRFESEEHDFFEAVRNAYLNLARAVPSRYRVIDAEPGQAEVSAAIGQILKELTT